jgi:uncharacterized protein YjbJ (UPF0337 family)
LSWLFLERGKLNCTTDRRPGTYAFETKMEKKMPNKDRIEGSAKQAKGTANEIVGKAVGDAKLRSEGKADKIKGKVQNAVGGLKDALKGK